MRVPDKFDNCIGNVSACETVSSQKSNKQKSRNTKKGRKSIRRHGLAAVNQVTELMTNCVDDTLCAYETLVNDKWFKQEPCDTEEESESVRSYVNMRDENMGDQTVVPRETEHTNECENGTVIGEGYIKEELRDLGMEQESILNYVDVKDRIIDDLTAVTQETELMTDDVDDKVCIYETLISGGYVKKELCETEDESGNIHNYGNIKDEKTNTKVNYVICCEECGEAYDLYCLKCPMLIRIFDSDNPDGRNKLPKNFLDLCETRSGVGVVALRAIPKGVVFGPFKDSDSFKDGAVSKRKRGNQKGTYKKDLKRLNWMQYIGKADESSHPNLTLFRYEDELYYRSDCHISMGDKLSMCWDSEKQENGKDVEKDDWEPPVCERLDDTYACTLCCVGYKSISHLEAHNSVCPEKTNKKDFCEEIVQCDFCKIYMDRNEYSDCHMDRCYKSNNKCAFKTRYKEDAKPIKCDSCNIRFWDRRLLVDHKKEVHAMIDKTYSCRKCKYSTRLRYAFRRHLAGVHDDPKLFPCTICHYTAKNTSILKQHVATHNSEKPIACSLCSYKTTRNSTLKRHMAIHNDDRPFACTLCPYTAKIKPALYQHMVTHADDKRFACSLCPYKGMTRANLNQHIATHNDDRSFACTLCPYKAKRAWTLKNHVAGHDEDTPFACALSPYKAKVESVLTLHVAAHNDDRLYACALCSYKATKKSSLRRHTAVHNDDRPFACTLCPHKATTKANLEQHLVTHNDRHFGCTLCPYNGKTKWALNQHMAFHNGDRPFACSFCTYKATTKCILKRHIVTHNDGRSFACDMCPYKANSNFTLERHVAAHNADRSFACALCPYLAMTKSNLTRHVATHSDDRPFACSLCPYKATIRSNLKRHIVSHNDDRLFACSLCPYKAKTKLSVKRHIAAHKDDKPSIKSDDDQVTIA